MQFLQLLTVDLASVYSPPKMELKLQSTGIFIFEDLRSEKAGAGGSIPSLATTPHLPCKRYPRFPPEFSSAAGPQPGEPLGKSRTRVTFPNRRNERNALI